MSEYLNLEYGSIIYKKENEKNIYNAIKNEANNSVWNMYGWSKDLRKSKDIYEIFEIMGLYSENFYDDEVCIYVNHTYYSDFFKYMLNASINYLEDSTIIMNTDENDVIKVTVKDHKLE